MLIKGDYQNYFQRNLKLLLPNQYKIVNSKGEGNIYLINLLLWLLVSLEVINHKVTIIYLIHLIL